MDANCDTSVENGPNENGSVVLEGEHDDETVHEIDDDDMMEHNKRLVIDTGTDDSGDVPDTELHNGVVLLRVENVKGKRDTIEKIALTEKDDGVDNHKWPNEDFSNSQNKLCKVNLTTNIINITGHSCDISGGNSVEIGMESSLLAPLATDVKFCGEGNVLKVACHGSVCLVEKSVRQESAQDGLGDNCISKSPPLVHLTANRDAKDSSRNSLNISASACDIKNILRGQTVADNVGHYLKDTEALNQERNQQENAEPTSNISIYQAETKATSDDDLCLKAEGTFRQKNDGLGDNCVSEDLLGDNCVNEGLLGDNCVNEGLLGGNCVSEGLLGGNCVSEGLLGDNCVNEGLLGDNCVNEGLLGDNCVSEGLLGDNCVSEGLTSLPVAPESAGDFPCLGTSSDDPDSEMGKETSHQSSDLPDGEHINVNTDENPSLDPSTAPQCTKNASSCQSHVSQVIFDNVGEVNLDNVGEITSDNVDEAIEETSKKESDQKNYAHFYAEIDESSSLDLSAALENKKNLFSSQSDDSDFSLDNNVCEAVKETSKQESGQENAVETITFVRTSSLLVHLDTDKSSQNLVREESNRAKMSFDAVSFVENETLKQKSDQENDIKTVTCIGKCSSIVHLDKVKDENNKPTSNFEASVSLRSDKSEILKCDLLEVKRSDQNCPTDGESLKQQELINHEVQKIKSDLQSTKCIKCEHSVTLEKEDDHLKKQEGMETDKQKNMTDFVQMESCSACSEAGYSGSPLSINKTDYTESGANDPSEILMTENKTVHCRSNGNVPELLITSSKMEHSAALEMDEPETLKTVTKTVPSESSEEDGEEILKHVDTMLPSVSLQEDGGEILTHVGTSLPSVSLGKDGDEILKHVDTMLSSVCLREDEDEMTQVDTTLPSESLREDGGEILTQVDTPLPSGSSGEDDLETHTISSKTATCINTKKYIDETVKIVDVTLCSESIEENQSQTIFNKTAHFEDPGGDTCEPVKNSSNKAMSKKKKRMKEKKGHRKKSKRKQKSEQVAESLRFVEVSRESPEELRIEADGRDDMYNRLSSERLLVDTYGDLLDQVVGDQQMGGVKEPGEIEFVQDRKKKDKKKKKRRRRVATVEEDDTGANASHQFPTYLDGFFLQYNNGSEELGLAVDEACETLDMQPRLLDEEDRVHHRHFSCDLSDSVKSDNCSDSATNRVEEMEGRRRRRRHERREHKERKRKQKERSPSYEAPYEREHHRGTEYRLEREWYRNEKDEERIRSGERKNREIDREHLRRTVIPGRDRRPAHAEENRRHTSRSPQDSRIVIAERSPICSSQRKRRSESRSMATDTERDRGLRGTRHKDQHNSGRMSHKRDRNAESSHVASSRHGSERSSDKENNRIHKRRRQMRTQESNASDYRDRSRNARRVRMRRTSMSSSGSASGHVRRRYDSSDDGHCIIISQESSDDDGASSDVILVESERIIINLDDDEDLPSGASIAHRRNESAIARKTSEPASSKNTNEPVVARKTSEPVVARKSNEPVVARKTNEPVVARKTNEPVVARKSNEPVVARKTNEPSIAKKGNEPAIAKKSSEPTVAKKSSEPVVGKKSNELAISEKGGESAIAKKGGESAIAKKGGESAIAKKGGESAISEKGDESAIAKKSNETDTAKKTTKQKTTEPISKKKTSRKNKQPPSEQSAGLSHSTHNCSSPKRPECVRDTSERQDCSAPPTSHKHSMEVETLPQITVSADYDPMFPTEEPEESDFRQPALGDRTLSASPVVGQRPPSPDYPPPKKGRPSTPPLPVAMTADALTSSLLYSSLPSPEAASSNLTFPAYPSQTLLPQASGPLPRRLGVDFEQASLFSSGPVINSLSPSKQLANCVLSPGASGAQQSLSPSQDTGLILPSQNSRLLVPSNTVPFLPPPPPPPFGVCLESVAAAGPVPQLASPQPLIDRHHIASHPDLPAMPQPSEIYSNQNTKVSPLQLAPTERSPQVSSLAADLSSSCSHSSRGHDGGDAVDMDFSSGDDDYHLELLSPKANKKRDLKRKKQQRQHSSLNQDASSGNSGNPGSSHEGSAQPGKTLSKDPKKLAVKDPKKLAVKDPKKLAVKETLDKSKVHCGKNNRTENSVPEEDDDVPASAADLTCKEKFLQKLYFQERVIEEVKMAVKPFYNSKKITKEQYKVILRKAVPKVCHNKKGNINPQKILHLVQAYVKKMINSPGGGKKKAAAAWRRETQSQR